jgi:hypothetical protein
MRAGDLPLNLKTALIAIAAAAAFISAAVVGVPSTGDATRQPIHAAKRVGK